MPVKRRQSDNFHGPAAAARSPRRRWRIDPRLLVWLLIGANVLLLLGILASPRGIQGFLRNRAEVAELESKLQRLSASNREQFEKIQRIKEDPRTQEQLIKNQLGWTRANETVIEFRAPADSSENQ